MPEQQHTYIGRVPFRTFETWYKLIGTIDTNSDTIPLIAIHGGPGAGCGTLEVLESLWMKAKIPVIVYDQVGCGRSTHLGDLPPETFTIDFFLEELSNLIQHLRLDKYHLLGHSWGGMLAIEHAVRQPIGLQKLILEGSPASMELCMQRQVECYKSLGEEYFKVIAKHDQDGVETEKFLQADEAFRTRFVSRTKPFPQVIIDGFQTIMNAYNICNTMWGLEKTLECTGTLKNWTIVPRLHLVKSDILILTGEYDYCGGKALEPYLDGTIKARKIIFKDAGHIAHIDAGEEYIACVAEYLRA